MPALTRHIGTEFACLWAQPFSTISCVNHNNFFSCQSCGNVARAGQQAYGSESGYSEGGSVSVDWMDTLSRWSSSDSDEQPPPGPGSVEALPIWDADTSGANFHPHFIPALDLHPHIDDPAMCMSWWPRHLQVNLHLISVCILAPAAGRCIASISGDLRSALGPGISMWFPDPGAWI